ncbi:putative RNA recognition motif domain, nucleotide-binding alpha-beta plait domain superfamily [Helianthus annuus]|nr:putative RNA recognition motif domain, nucleotide-binding alpha-beta plait domain superfamily [Helianthus annuus]KAJ0959313.1 putative RNA recognition motif domain, nucleotide-binding alpha-beta plait domain superfamily [Helianthus annuus]
MSGSKVKLFVTNLPEGCTPWDLRRCLESFGEISGTYVARKRDKHGCRFGFASFSGVKDSQELLRSLGGIRMGDFKLKINVARFAVENSRASGVKEGPVENLKPTGQKREGGTFNVRDVRSYRDVVGTSSTGNGFIGAPLSEEKVVVVPDRVGAFKELRGVAVVGRTANLETLVDIDRLFNIAKIVVANVQYLGGMSLLVSFHDEEAANRFLELKNIWEPWFTKLDPWRGQTLPFERVVWLKLSWIPLHLFEPDVMGQVGGLFGKVLHVPNSFEEDQDLSFIRVGVLVGHSSKIEEEVVLKWKSRSFRIRVEEDHEVWVPDCFSRLSDSGSEGFPASDASPADDMHFSGDGVQVEDQVSDGVGVGHRPAEKSPVCEVPSSHADPPEMYGENGYDAANINEEREFLPFITKQGQQKSVGGGPEVLGIFISGSGEKVGRPRRRSAMGQRLSVPKTHRVVNSSPEEVRPRKRSRGSTEEEVPGFGFVGSWRVRGERN